MLVLSLFEYAIELNKLNLIFFCVRKYPPSPFSCLSHLFRRTIGSRSKGIYGVENFVIASCITTQHQTIGNAP